jgi:hypothetical protein
VLIADPARLVEEDQVGNELMTVRLPTLLVRRQSIRCAVRAQDAVECGQNRVEHGQRF